MSALPPITTKKADIDYVGFVPIADIVCYATFRMIGGFHEPSRMPTLPQ
jgi:hypothetical protein